MIHNLERKLDDILQGDSLSESYSSSSYPAAADSDPTAVEKQLKKTAEQQTAEERVTAGAASTDAEQHEKDLQHHMSHRMQLSAITQASAIRHERKTASGEGDRLNSMTDNASRSSKPRSGRGNTTHTHPYPLNRNLSIEKVSSTVICSSNISFYFNLQKKNIYRRNIYRCRMPSP